LSDRYGDSGLIGILTCKPRQGEPAAWEIDNWLLSCRVLGRRMEVFMLRITLDACRAANVRELYASYVPTAKNGQVADLLPRFGFEPCGSHGETKYFVLDVEKAVLPDFPIVLAPRSKIGTEPA
jgi:predicted enzyme involved in methoxymalonyl-ACP biosynthesis